MRYLFLFLLPILILSCDLVPGDQRYSDESFANFFQIDRVHHLKVVFTREEWAALTNDMWQSARDWGSLGRGNDYGTNNFFFNASFYRKAKFVNQDSGRVMEDVGIKVRGSTSRFVPEYTDGSFKWVHFKISFSHEFDGNEDVYGSPAIPTIRKKKRKLYDVRGLTLKYTRGDSTWVKEPFSYHLLRRFGLPAPHTAYAQLRIEIEGYTNINYGLFQVIEPIDKTFTEKNFGQSSHLYKCLITANGPADLQVFEWAGSFGGDFNKDVAIGIEKMDPVNMAEAGGWNLSDWPVDPTQLQVYRPKYDVVWTDTIENARDLLSSFIMDLYAKNGQAFDDWIDSAIDVDSLLRVLAVDVLLGQWDSYFLNFNNFYLYYHPLEQRFKYIPYDYDGCMYDLGIRDVSVYNLPITNRSITNWPSTNATLINKILDIPRYRQQFYDNVLFLATHPDWYNWTAVSKEMAHLQSVIQPYATDPTIIHDEPAGYVAIDSWNFKAFIQARLTVVSNELNL